MSDRTTATRGARTNVQKAAAIVGVVFLLVGVLGFIPGITTNFAARQTSTDTEIADDERRSAPRPFWFPN